MTKYNKYLIAFMKAKAKKIKEYSDVPYFTKRDEQAIAKWTHAKKIWNDLYYSIMSESIEGLFDTTCPFCIKHYEPFTFNYEYCNKCEYGKTHGICGSNSNENDFSRILLQGFHNSVTLTSDALTNTFYVKTVKSIEKRIK